MKICLKWFFSLWETESKEIEDFLIFIWEVDNATTSTATLFYFLTLLKKHFDAGYIKVKAAILYSFFQLLCLFSNVFVYFIADNNGNCENHKENVSRELFVVLTRIIEDFAIPPTCMFFSINSFWKLLDVNYSDLLHIIKKTLEKEPYSIMIKSDQSPQNQKLRDDIVFSSHFHSLSNIVK